MNADADMDLFSFVLLGVLGTQVRLNSLRTLHGIDDGGKIYQKRITDRLNDRTMTFSHGLADDPVMDVEQPQHAGFIGAHLAAKAHDVSEHDRSQPAGLGGPRAGGVLCHSADYPLRTAELSNRQGACRWPASRLRCSGKSREQGHARGPSHQPVSG